MSPRTKDILWWLAFLILLAIVIVEVVHTLQHGIL